MRVRFKNHKILSLTAPLSSGEPVDPVITLVVRAYDLGIPSLDSEVPVHIYTEDMFSRYYFSAKCILKSYKWTMISFPRTKIFWHEKVTHFPIIL